MITEDQQELREEREFICKAEGVDDYEIALIIEKYPEIYGTK